MKLAVQKNHLRGQILYGSPDLVKNGVKASTYLLALDKVEESVEMLLKGRIYRDALTLAKLRLGEDHPLIETILQQWAERAALGGNVLQSAKTPFFLDCQNFSTRGYFFS